MTLATAAFGFVAALAWNDAIQALFIEFFGEPNTLFPMLTYAIIVTIAAVFVTLWLSQLVEEN
tara:strand:+ start:2933 stop:3121 length:189 start_codon:yes stop_codon:yes gene_type:complete